jgi:hypothetical protein
MLKLIELKNIPVEGIHKGVVKNTELKSGTNEEGESYEDLVVTVGLETKDSTGKPYQVEKTYNLKGRGLASFRKDYKAWQGKKLTDKDLAEFDADKLMNNQPVRVEVKHKKEGSETQAVVDKLLPVSSAAPATT